MNEHKNLNTMIEEKDAIERGLKLSEEIIEVMADKDHRKDIDNFPALKRVLTENPYAGELLENLGDELYLKNSVEGLADVEASERRLRRKYGRIKRIRTFRKVVVGFASAAALIAFIVTGIFNAQNSVSTDTDMVVPGSVKAVLTLADDTTIELDPTTGTTYMIHDSSIEIGESGLKYTQHSDVEKLTYNILTVPRGGEYCAELSDGTRVWLNAETRLKFPVGFIGEERRVFLSGEAYFAVTNDTEKPFIVETDLGEIRVYGTEFNISSYPDRALIEATLVEGIISFRSPEAEEILIDPGFRLSYGPEHAVPILEKVNVQDPIAWKNKQFRFDEQTLYDIMKTLARWYDMDVQFDTDELRNIELSGILNRSDDVRVLLRLFEETADVSFTVEGKRITVTNK